jgi:biopolymer transport protein ExbD
MGMSAKADGPNINVTPLIDVLLVLLVIFLVIIPVMMKVEPVLLPENDPQSHPMRPPVAIKLNADATATIDEGVPIMASDLLATVKRRVSAGSTVFVDFEDGVPWSDVVGVVDGVRGLVVDADTISVAVRIRE